MVYASETFGAAPVLVASLITSMGFASHHSPDHYRHISSVGNQSQFDQENKRGRKLIRNQYANDFRESFQEERAAIRGIVPKEKEGEQQYWELFPKEGRPIDSGNQSKKTAYRERQIQKREKDNRKRFRESFQRQKEQLVPGNSVAQKKKPTIQGIVPRRRYKRFRFDEQTKVRKVLNAVPDKFLPIVATIEMIVDFKTVKLEEIIGKLKTYEERIKMRTGSREDNSEKLLFTRHGNYRNNERNDMNNRRRNDNLTQGRDRGRFARDSKNDDSYDTRKRNSREQNNRRDIREEECYNCHERKFFCAWRIICGIMYVLVQSDATNTEDATRKINLGMDQKDELSILVDRTIGSPQVGDCSMMTEKVLRRDYVLLQNLHFSVNDYIFLKLFAFPEVDH
ncbi:hypothetical protein Tco_0386299 [Tanacetum coccineum]